MIVVNDLAFHYKNSKNVLSDISFEVDRGQCVCILGPNGTGKTTLLKCLLGFYHLQHGSILIDGTDITSLSAGERARHLAYVTQSTGLTFPYTVEEVIQMGRITHMKLGASLSASDRKITNEAMERLGIQELSRRNFQTLSGGERQMVLIARALAQQADYMILDEPTAALDYSNQVRILEMIRSLSQDGLGVLMTTHFPDHAFMACTQALLMREGTVMDFGKPEEVVTGERLSRLYQVPVGVTDVAVNISGKEVVQKVCIPLLDGK